MTAVGRRKNWVIQKGSQGDRVRICTYKGKNMTISNTIKLNSNWFKFILFVGALTWTWIW